MSESASARGSQPRTNRLFFADLARAYGGAFIFSIPMLMTMEMWALGFAVDRYRLFIFIVVGILLLAGLSFYEGFADTFGGKDDLLDTLVAYFAGFTASACVLTVFGIINAKMSADELIGKIAIQSVGASLGAMFGESILGPTEKAVESSKETKRSKSYAGQLFLTAIGALYLSMSISATEEISLIAYKMSDWHMISLAILTLIVIHGFIVGSGRGKAEQQELTLSGQLSLFFRQSVVSYVVVLAVSGYILWTFGTLDGLAMDMKLRLIFVLGFPASIGGAASKLLL